MSADSRNRAPRNIKMADQRARAILYLHSKIGRAIDNSFPYRDGIVTTECMENQISYQRVLMAIQLFLADDIPSRLSSHSQQYTHDIFHDCWYIIQVSMIMILGMATTMRANGAPAMKWGDATTLIKAAINKMIFLRNKCGKSPVDRCLVWMCENGWGTEWGGGNNDEKK